MEIKKEKRFILSKKLLNKNIIIHVVNQNFKYDHDDLFNNQIKRFSIGGRAHKSWENYGYYVKTNGYPNWACNHISKI